MKRLLALVWFAWATSGAPAAEPVAPLPPAIEVRVRAIGELTGILEYAGDVLMQPEAGKRFAEIVKTLGAGEKGLEGLDPSRPVGGYVRISEDIANSAVVVMVPVKDEAAFLALLKEKLKVEPKKDKDGLYSVEILPLPVGAIHFRFLHGYAYATIRNAKSIDAAAVIKPGDFFSAPLKPIAAAMIHWDRFPADVKKVLVGQIELQLVEATKDWGGSELQKQARRGLLDIGVDMVKTMIQDGRQLALMLDVDPKTDTLAATVRLTAKPKTTLETNLKSWADRESVAADVSAEHPVAAMGLVVKVPTATHEKLGKIIDVLFDDLLAGANDDAKPLVTKLVDAVVPTLKSDDLQGGWAVVRPGKEKAVRLHAAVKAEKGAELEKVLKEFAPFLMGAEATVKFDEEKFAGRNLHAATLSNPDLKNTFGTETIWIASSDDLVALETEDKPKMLKAYLEAKPAKRPLFSFEVSVAQLGMLTEKNLPAGKYEALVQSIFGQVDTAGRDTFKVAVTGGQELNVKVDLKGQAFKLLVALDREKKK